MTPKGHFEIIWPLERLEYIKGYFNTANAKQDIKGLRLQLSADYRSVNLKIEICMYQVLPSSKNRTIYLPNSALTSLGQKLGKYFVRFVLDDGRTWFFAFVIFWPLKMQELATYCTKTEMIRDFFSVNLRVQCACKSENCHLLHLSGTRTLLLF